MAIAVTKSQLHCTKKTRNICCYLKVSFVIRRAQRSFATETEGFLLCHLLNVNLTATNKLKGGERHSTYGILQVD